MAHQELKRLLSLRAYMLNTQNAEKKNVLYSCVACFMNTVALKCVRIYSMYRVTQAEYVFRILMAASQEYVNTYSTCRLAGAVVH